jgi:phage terminase large subunit GpA-like protein
MSVSEAAEKYRHINNPGSYVGPYQNDMAPYLVDIMNTLTSRKHKGVVFVKPVQCGGTELTLNWACHSTIVDPADMLLFHPTRTFARDFSKRRIDKLIRSTPEMRARMIPRRDADNTFDKTFRAGMMLTIAWPSATETAGRPVGRQAISDYDRIPDDIGGEGNAFDLISKRGTTFGSFAMTLAESTPGRDSTDPKWTPKPSRPHEGPPCVGIVGLYNRGDRRRWKVPCPDCHEYFEPTHELLVWHAKETIEDSAASTCMACPQCGVWIEPRYKREMNKLGVWVGEKQTVDKFGIISGSLPDTPIASFWLKGPAAAFSKWSEIVANKLQAEADYLATGSEEALRVVYNTDCGEVYVPKSLEDLRSPEDVKSRAVDIGQGIIPENVRCLIPTVDIQKGRFVVQVHGIAYGGDVYLIDRYDIFKSNRHDSDGDRQYCRPASYIEDWDLLTEKVLERGYPLNDGSGREMKIKAFGYDIHGSNGVTDNAYKFYRKCRSSGYGSRTFPLRGTGLKTAPRAVTKYPDTGRSSDKEGAKGEIPVLTINTNLIKDMVDAKLERTKEGDGGMYFFPDWLPDSFYNELCAETRNSKGEWENLAKVRNESFDLLGYCEALMIKLGVDRVKWDNPPAWLDIWDNNPLVINPNKKDDKPMKSRLDLADLGALLG